MDCCISINADFKSITFYSINKQKVVIEKETYKAKAFEPEFYEMLKNSVSLRYKNAGLSGRVCLILPDTLFLTDNIKIPIIHRKAMENSLGLAVDALYKNSSDIKFMASLLGRDKKTATFNIVGVRKEIVVKLTEAIERSGATLSGITFGANACVNGAMALNSKLKGLSYVLVDVRREYTTYSFVVRGNTIGYYSLPFGYSMLKDNVLKDEITLFDHTAGDLLVLNAKEKAKRKDLTSLGEDFGEEVEITEDNLDDFADDGDDEYDDQTQGDVKVGALYKRLNRKLPKFMTRPTPQTPQDFEYENFRVFVKWTLELIKNNAENLASNQPSMVLVNMPEKFNHVLERVNKEQDENKIVFQPLVVGKQNEEYKKHLKLFGGFFIKKYNKNNNF